MNFFTQTRNQPIELLIFAMLIFVTTAYLFLVNIMAISGKSRASIFYGRETLKFLTNKEGLAAKEDCSELDQSLTELKVYQEKLFRRELYQSFVLNVDGQEVQVSKQRIFDRGDGLPKLMQAEVCRQLIISLPNSFNFKESLIKSKEAPESNFYHDLSQGLAKLKKSPKPLDIWQKMTDKDAVTLSDEFIKQVSELSQLFEDDFITYVSSKQIFLIGNLKRTTLLFFEDVLYQSKAEFEQTIARNLKLIKVVKALRESFTSKL